MHLLNYSLQINHKFYKLAHLGNCQLKPTRLGKAAPAGTTGLRYRTGWTGRPGWQLLVTEREALGVAAEL